MNIQQIMFRRFNSNDLDKLLIYSEHLVQKEFYEVKILNFVYFNLFVIKKKARERQKPSSTKNDIENKIHRNN